MINFGEIWNNTRAGLTNVGGGILGFLGHASTIIVQATGILKDADDPSVRGFVAQVLQRFPGLISANLLLETLSKLIDIIYQAAQESTESVKDHIENILDRISDLITLIGPDLLLNIVMKLIKAILKAIIGRVGSLPAIRRGIFSNAINAATLIFIRDQATQFSNFLLDLVEAAKCYVSADSLGEGVGANNRRGQYNEFDFSKSMNRHALVSQIQRLAKSVIFILRKVAKPQSFQDINLTEITKLQSDSGTLLGGTIMTEPAGEQSQPPERGQETLSNQAPRVQNEKWLFVNGIAGEQYWLRLACDKLRAKFSREITGIFNRGDGILWDIIECAGERSTYVSPGEESLNDRPSAEDIVESQQNLIQRTDSSRKAQKTLLKELDEALRAGGWTAHKYIIIIAHSQGCLILRHVLEELVADAVDDIQLRHAMLDRLCVFTFGNPSLHWKTQDKHPNQWLNEDWRSKDPTHLSSYVYCTEHFANSRDFVAKLGVLSENRPSNSGYAEEEVFINEREDWVGHLFGSQYSLDPAHYTDRGHQPNGHNSLLLACGNAERMEDAQQNIRRQSVISATATNPSTG